MSTNDFSQARGALSNTLTVLGPVLTALQQADTVFGVLANAEKHKKVLETEVADYKAELEKTKKAVGTQQQKLKDVTAEIAVAEADADARIKAVLAEEKAQIAAAKQGSADMLKKLSEDTARAQQADAATLAQARAASEKAVAGMISEENALKVSIATLEKKLDTLRASAQKFAAALTGD